MRILIVEDDAEAGAAMVRGLSEPSHQVIHHDLLYLLLDPNGGRIWGNIAESRIGQFDEHNTTWMRLSVEAPAPWCWCRA